MRVFCESRECRVDIRCEEMLIVYRRASSWLCSCTWAPVGVVLGCKPKNKYPQAHRPHTNRPSPTGSAFWQALAPPPSCVQVSTSSTPLVGNLPAIVSSLPLPTIEPGPCSVYHNERLLGVKHVHIRARSTRACLVCGHPQCAWLTFTYHTQHCLQNSRTPPAKGAEPLSRTTGAQKRAALSELLRETSHPEPIRDDHLGDRN